MFDYIRNNTRLMGLILAIFMVPAFVLVGVDGYSRFNERGVPVAVVAGQSITQEQWDAAHRTEVDRMRASMPNVDAKLLDSDEARYATLERLVSERVLAAAALEMRLLTSDRKLANDLQQNQAIANLRKPDGKLDMDAYRQLLSAQGMTPEMFEAQVRADLSQRQVAQGVAASAFATPAAAQASLAAFFEQREVQWVRFDSAAYKARVNVTADDIKTYYNANPSQFQAPEVADVEYVVLDMAAVSAALTLPEADVKAYYEQNAERYASKEERRARHILFTVAEKATATERDAVRARASALLTQLQSAPGSFAEVAKKQSQDPGSAPAGGDLGFFQRGAMVKSFEDAAFALEKGALSGVVESEFGYHLIQLADIKPAQKRPFEQVRAEIEAELKKQQAQRAFAEKAEVFSNLVYEQPDALAPVAERLKLKVQLVSNVGRLPGANTPAALSNDKLLSALFSSESVEKKRNTEAVETGPNQLVAARVITHRPAHTRDLSEVEAAVRERLVAERAHDLARDDGVKSLAQWKDGAAASRLSVAAVVSRNKPGTLQARELLAALKADTQTLPAWVGLDLAPQGYTVIKVSKVLSREAPPADVAAQELQQYQQWWSSAETQAYLNALRTRFKTEIKVKKPAAPGGAAG